MNQIRRLGHKFAFYHFSGLLALLVVFGQYAQAIELDVYLAGHGKLKTWSEVELKKLPQRSIQEKSNGGPSIVYRGPTLDQIILSTIDSLSIEQRAQIDLVILKENQGREISIPRSFITKYPVVFDHGKVAPPIQSRPKSMSEELPIQTYFCKNVTSIELAYSKTRFASVYLKNRKNPAAIRGEKYFVQTCLGCHGSSQHQKSYISILGEIKNTEKTDSHGKIYGFPKISNKTTKALKTYLEAYRQENTQIGQ